MIPLDGNRDRDCGKHIREELNWFKRADKELTIVFPRRDLVSIKCAYWKQKELSANVEISGTALLYSFIC